MIEDSERGLRAAKAAGLACWVIPSELTLGGRFEAADAVLADLAAAAARLLEPRRSTVTAVRAGAVCSAAWNLRSRPNPNGRRGSRSRASGTRRSASGR